MYGPPRCPANGCAACKGDERRNDPTFIDHFARSVTAALQSSIDITIAQFANGNRYQPITEIGIRCQLPCRPASDRWRARNVDRIGDQRGGDIRRSRIAGQHRYGIGDAERMAATAPAACGDAADHIVRRDPHLRAEPTCLGIRAHADIEVGVRSEPESNVATVIDVGTIKLPLVQKCLQNMVSNSARDGRHRCDKRIASKFGRSCLHLTGYGAVGGYHALRAGLSQQIEFTGKRIENRLEIPCGLPIGLPNLVSITIGTNDQVDRTMLQMQTMSVGQEGGARPLVKRSYVIADTSHDARPRPFSFRAGHG